VQFERFFLQIICFCRKNVLSLHKILTNELLKFEKQMKFALKQLFNYSTVYFRSDQELEAMTVGFFCDNLFVPLFLVSCHFFSEKLDCFIRLFLFGFVFALFYLQFDRRKLTAGLYKLHRLLQFTRSVSFPPRLQAVGWSGWEKRVLQSMQLPEYRSEEICVLLQNGKTHFCGIFLM